MPQPGKTDAPLQDMTEAKVVATGISQGCNCLAGKFQRFASAQ